MVEVLSSSSTASLTLNEKVEKLRDVLMEESPGLTERARGAGSREARLEAALPFNLIVSDVKGDCARSPFRAPIQ